MILRIVILSQS